MFGRWTCTTVDLHDMVAEVIESDSLGGWPRLDAAQLNCCRDKDRPDGLTEISFPSRCCRQRREGTPLEFYGVSINPPCFLGSKLFCNDKLN